MNEEEQEPLDSLYWPGMTGHIVQLTDQPCRRKPRAFPFGFTAPPPQPAKPKQQQKSARARRSPG